MAVGACAFFFFSSRRRHTRWTGDWSSDVCSSDLWKSAAGRVGIQLDPTFRNADIHSSADFHGAVLTYAQVGMAPAVHRRRTMTRRTLVILDEIHHAGEDRKSVV